MTIHNLMNAMNVSPDVIIEVFDYRSAHCYYIGKYDECIKSIYDMEIFEFIVQEIEKKFFDGLPDGLRITKVKIYVEPQF